jgi:hypothetical protein
LYLGNIASASFGGNSHPAAHISQIGFNRPRASGHRSSSQPVR